MTQRLHKINKERLITVTKNNTMSNGTTITWKHKWGKKQMYGYFKRQTIEISQKKTWPRKRNLKREKESLLTGGARCVVVIGVGNEHGDTSSNPGRY